MAIVLRLANYAQTITYNLLTGDLYALMDTWSTDFGDMGEMVETITLAARGETDSAIMTAAQTLTELQDNCIDFWGDKLNNKSVWWEEKTADETAKRALIYSIDLLPLQKSKYTKLLGGSTAFFKLTVIHDAIYEDVSETTVVNAQSMSCLSGTKTIAAIKGSAPARISQVLVTGVNGVNSKEAVWLGIRPTGYGTTLYQRYWEAAYGDLGADSSLASDVTWGFPASSNNVVDITFATDNTLTTCRINLQLLDADSARYDDNVGDYIVLLRYKLVTGSSGEILVQAQSGYEDGKKIHEAVILDDDALNMKAIARISLPPTGARSETSISSDDLANFEFDLYAKRLSGDYVLRVDGYYLIPAKHCIFTEDAEVEYNNAFVEFKTLEDGSFIARQKNSSSNRVEKALLPGNTNWVLPVEGGILVLAAANTDVNTDTVTVTLKAFYRHRMFREA
ncbi:MAG: hypothetical protein JW908_00525 [Anaerolineales bacterium]|nr:hypothetical protein [Anaerolineales bacterium]